MVALQQKHYDNGNNGSVYLLHMAYPDNSIEHYVGYCRQASPESRVIQQLAGKGAVKVKRAIKAGALITHACSWFNVHIRFEAYLHALRNEDYYCPLCKAGLTPKADDLPEDVDPNLFGKAKRAAAHRPPDKF